MCLIVAKPKGMPLPTKKNLKKWFRQYPDGFGVAFQYQGRVRLLKGALTKRGMIRLITQMEVSLAGENTSIEAIDLVIQFRQAVTGSASAKYCHPFPISPDQEELDSLDVMTDCTLAHNGVIDEYAYLPYGNSGSRKKNDQDINDAQEFIKDYLVDLGDTIFQPSVQKLIENYTMSKFALLSAEGISYIGTFIKDGGYLYSNLGYKFPIYASQHSHWTDELDDKAYYNYLKHGNGIVCDWCQLPSEPVYNPPDDELSTLCAGCFMTYMGREPQEEDRLY